MDNDEASVYIIDALGKGKCQDDIILTLCEKYNLTWQEAETLVKNVQDENERVIVKKQFPLLFSLALAIFIGGIIGVGYGCLIIYSEFRLIQPGLNNINLVFTDMDISTKLYYGLRMILSAGGTPITIIIFGVGMILGSLIGMRDAWSDILG
jgi:hypothetical protein